MAFTGFDQDKQSGNWNLPDCYCYTCGREFHHLGIMSHRAAHRRRKENCQIKFSTGKIHDYNFEE